MKVAWQSLASILEKLFGSKYADQKGEEAEKLTINGLKIKDYLRGSI